MQVMPKISSILSNLKKSFGTKSQFVGSESLNFQTQKFLEFNVNKIGLVKLRKSNFWFYIEHWIK